MSCGLYKLADDGCKFDVAVVEKSGDDAVVEFLHCRSGAKARTSVNLVFAWWWHRHHKDLPSKVHSQLEVARQGSKSS